MSFDRADPNFQSDPTAADPEADDLFARIHLLASAQAEGRLTVADAGRLEAMVIGDPAARRLYVEYVRETASLRWYGGGAAAIPGVARDGPAIGDVPVTGETPAAVVRDLVRLDEDDDLLVARPLAPESRFPALVSADRPAARGRLSDGNPSLHLTSAHGLFDPSFDQSMVLPALSADLMALPDDADEEPAPLPSPASIPMPAAPRFDRRRTLRWSAAAAAALAMATGAWWMATRGPADGTKPIAVRPAPPAPETRPAAPEPTATLMADVGATWDASAWPDGHIPLVADRMLPGPWVLKGGSVRFTMDGGADVIVHGPAKFDLPSGKQVILSAGRLTAHAGKGAAGFEVTTSSADVVDLGTEFGVSVAADGATEAHVMVGKVALAARESVGPPVAVSANAAGRVEAGGQSVAAVAYRPGDFAHGLPLLDLADVVAGGDGTQGRRGAGVDVSTGTSVDAPPAANRLASKIDGKFRRVPGRPMLAGVFAPTTGGQPVQLDPAGHTFDRFAVAEGSSWYWLWAGGTIPMLDPKQGFEAYPSTLAGVDYAAKGHGLLFMQPNKGVTFDLAALRVAHPGRRFRQFKAVCGNTSADVERTVATDKSDVWLFVDGKLAFSRHPLMRGTAPIDVAIDVPADARYLTLVVTDGGDRLQSDWITFGDPRLE